jgi:hypothetical protein
MFPRGVGVGLVWMIAGSHSRQRHDLWTLLHATTSIEDFAVTCHGGLLRRALIHAAAAATIAGPKLAGVLSAHTGIAVGLGALCISCGWFVGPCMV